MRSVNFNPLCNCVRLKKHNTNLFIRFCKIEYILYVCISKITITDENLLVILLMIS